MVQRMGHFLVLPVSPAAAAYILAIASDVGFLQARSDVACYSPNPNIAAYAGENCTNALLSGALHNHLDIHINPEAPSTAYYNASLDFLGDHTWHVPSSMKGSQVIVCYQGGLSLTDKHSDPTFHTWCHFVNADNQFSFSDALVDGGVCSHVHVGGARAERDRCVSPPEVPPYALGGWMLDSVLGLIRLPFWV